MQQFILIGIDHGTTNSCVSIMDSNGPEVLNADSGDMKAQTLPSYVHMSKEAGIQIGALARNAVISKAPGTGFTGYKPRLGSDSRFAFAEVDKVLTAPEMGQLVISKLLEPCQEKLGYPPLAAVVTVPAKFTTPKYDGTREASKLAGLEQVVLLQEPIAASMAYGFGMARDARWIVFDIGGGTLDVSLVSLRNGNMEIPEKGNTGDEDLGGRLFDTKLMDLIIGPKKDDIKNKKYYKSLDPNYKSLRDVYDLEDFNEKSYPNEWGRLALAVEDAKIRLSKESDTIVEVEGVLCTDNNGKDVEVNIPVSRKVYEKLIEADISRGVNCCHMLLRNNHLKPKDIDFIIMVGGPSRTPYLQEQLKKRLAIELKADLDPMTVVAKGAAVYAATQELDSEIIEKLKENLPPAEVDVNLSFPPFSKDDICPVSGDISSSEIDDFSDLQVNIRRNDGDWETTLMVEDDGLFEGDVFLKNSDKPVQSEFTIIIKDKRGQILSELNDLKIWHPWNEGATPKLSNGLKIGTYGNNTRTLLRAGTTLPAEEEQAFRTVKAVKAGNSKDSVRIEVLEGVNNLLGNEDIHADCNMPVGELLINGDKLDDDLPANSQVDITLHQNQSREVKVMVYIPILDQEFEAVFNSKDVQPDFNKMITQFSKVKNGLEESRKLAIRQPDEDVDELFEMMADEQLIEEIEGNIKKIKNDDESSQILTGTYKKILCLAGTANCIFDMQQDIRLKFRLTEIENKAKDDGDKEKLDHIKEAFGHAESEGSKEDMDRLENEIDDLSSSILGHEFIDLLFKIEAFGDCIVNKRDKYLLNDTKSMELLIKVSPLILEAKEYLNKLFEKAGWKRGDNNQFELILNYLKKGLLTDEEINKVKYYTNEIIESVPQIDDMVRDFLSILTPPDSGSGTDGELHRINIQ